MQPSDANPPPPGSLLVPSGDAVPWERRAELGFFRALWQQWRESMFAPDPFWRRVRPDGAPADALYYGWLMAAAQAVISAPFTVVLFALQAAIMHGAFANTSAPPPPDLQRILDIIFGPAGLLALVLGQAVFGVVLYPVVMIVSSAIIHVVGQLFGAARNGFWATFRVVGYAASPLVFLGVPMLGVGAFVYFLIQEIFGLMHVQQTTGGRAAAAVLGVPVLLFCCCTGLWFVLFFGMMAALPHRP